THAALDREVPLGPYVTQDPLEHEHEAYTLECRYVLAQLAAHPKEALADRAYDKELPALAEVVGNYDQFLQRIDTSYRGGNSVAGEDVKTVGQLVQDETGRTLARRAAYAARRLEGLVRTASAELLGLKETQSALDAFQKDYDRRDSDFRARTLPLMQAQTKAQAPAWAAQALADAAAAPTGEDRFFSISAANTLARMARAQGSDDGGVLDKARDLAVGTARADLARAGRTRDAEGAYGALWEAESFADLSSDAAVKADADRAVRRYVEQTLAGGGGDARLFYSSELAKRIGDSALQARVEAARAAPGGAP
ncbi:MAG: hypothetical protein KGL53_12250, partial [Elusimicrobia bacterium]|nr:hypothetical protein [Elusimicrobiota bacterium]